MSKYMSGSFIICIKMEYDNKFTLDQLVEELNKVDGLKIASTLKLIKTVVVDYDDASLQNLVDKFGDRCHVERNREHSISKPARKNVDS